MAVILYGVGPKVHKGYAVWAGGSNDVEQDTFTCKHCCRVVFIVASQPLPGGGCTKCGGLICSKCVDIGTCTPYEKKMDLLEAAIRQRVETDLMLSKNGIGV